MSMNAEASRFKPCTAAVLLYCIVCTTSVDVDNVELM